MISSWVRQPAMVADDRNRNANGESNLCEPEISLNPKNLPNLLNKTFGTR